MAPVASCVLDGTRVTVTGDGLTEGIGFSMTGFDFGYNPQ